MPATDRRSEDDASAQRRTDADRPEPTSRREVLLVALLLAAVTSVFFFDVVFLGRTLLTSPQVSPVVGRGRPGSVSPAAHVDLNPYLLDPLASAAGHEPLFKKMSALIHAGRLPLWNANSGLGRPLLGSSSPLDSPLRLPVSVWPNPSVWDGFLLARFVVAGLFTYLLARRLGLGPAGAAGGALAYPFSGYFMLRLNMGHVDFAAMIPVVLYALELLVEASSPPRILFAAAAIALGILADNPETAVILVLFAVGYYAFRAIVERRQDFESERTTRAVPLAAVVVIGTGLTALVIVPFLRFAGYFGFAPLSTSYHATGQAVGLVADPLSRMISAFFPFLRGAPLRGFHGGFTSLRDYTGVVMPMVGLLGLANRPFMRRAGWFFGVGLLVTLAKLYGILPVNWIGRVPPLRSILFFRYLPPVATFCLAMLAAAGIDRVARGRLRAWQPIAAAAAVAGLVVVLLMLNRDPLRSVPTDHFRALMIFGGVLVILAALAALAGGRGRLRAGSVVLVALMAGELFVFTLPTKGEVARLARIFYPDRRMAVIERPPRRDVFAEPRFVSFLKGDPSVHRVFGMDGVLRGNASAAFGLDNIIEVNPLRVNRAAQYLVRFVFLPRGELPPGQPPGQGPISPFLVGNPMFDLLNVKYVLTLKTDLAQLAPEQYELVYDGEVLIYRNRDALPRAFVVHRVRTAQDASGAMRLLEEGGVDPSAEAVVEGSLPSEEAAALSGAAGGTSDVRITTYRDGRVMLSVHTDRPGMLVLTDTYYPGWKATVDGVPAPIFATDEAFRSVYVTPGDHLVAFSYAPGTFKAGVAISALSLLSLVAYAAWEAKRRARSSGSPTPAGPDPPGPMTPGTSPAEEPPGPGPTGSDPEPARAPPA